jgi:RNA polymerase sigma factor (sigma-70 family)
MIPQDPKKSSSADTFPTTHWSVLARLQSSDMGDRALALEHLCVQYHYPLYCYIRRRGLDHHDAQDALHDFMSRLLRLGTFATADAEKGRLRAYLLTALQRFLINWQRGQQHRLRELKVDTETLLMHAENRYRQENFSDHDTPDRIYQRKWAAELMETVLQRLQSEYEQKNRVDLFQALRPVLISGGSLKDEGSADVAAGLGMKPGAVRVALMRMLRDYRRLLRDEIVRTVQNPDEAKEEFQELLGVFAK